MSSQAYSFDHANNMTIGATPWTFSATNNRLLARPNCLSFVYDAAGNQTSRVCYSNTWVYTYDALERLTAVDSTFAVYTYDVLGQRIAKRALGTVTRFVWRGGQVVYETDSVGTMRHSYTWGSGTDDLVAIHDYPSNQQYYVVQDRLRSVRALVDTSGTWRAA